MRSNGDLRLDRDGDEWKDSILLIAYEFLPTSRALDRERERERERDTNANILNAPNAHHYPLCRT